MQNSAAAANFAVAADFFPTLSAFCNPLDLFDQSLLLDMLFLGAPQLRTGLGFLFFFKVSFMKHPNGHQPGDEELQQLLVSDYLRL